MQHVRNSITFADFFQIRANGEAEARDLGMAKQTIKQDAIDGDGLFICGSARPEIVHMGGSRGPPVEVD
jgi:hypothetical protein